MSMDFQSLNKERYVSITNSLLWKHKNASDTAYIQRKLQKHLSSDILCLYEKSQFVDLKFESSKGYLYSHRVILASRSPACWALLAEIEHIQLHKLGERTKPPGILTVSLPRVNFKNLKTFIRSLYTNNIDETAGLSLKVHLENLLFSLKQSLIITQTLFLEKLNIEEEQRLEQILLSQLKKGEISTERGNLRDVTHLVPTRLRCPTITRRRSPSGRFSSPLFHTSTAPSQLFPAPQHRSRIPISAKASRRRNTRCISPYDSSETSTMSSEDSLRNLNESLAAPDEPSETSVLKERDKICAKSDSPFFGTEASNKGRRSTSSEDNTVIHYSASTDNNSNGVLDSPLCGGVRSKERRTRGGGGGGRGAKASSEPWEEVRKRPSALSLGEEEQEEEDSDPNGLLHETSSLEVEIASSNGDQSLSPDSAKSEDCPRESEKPRDVTDEEKPRDLTDEEDQARGFNEEGEKPPRGAHPHKPLVRTRTFDLIEPTCAAVSVQEEKEEEEEEEQIVGEEKEKEEKSEKKDKRVAEKHCLRAVPAASPPSDGPPSHSAPPETRPPEEDPAKLRELERKKGSLLFEHNLQTFSNIPPTNLMSASVGSDGSLGLSSLYSSMIESAILTCMNAAAAATATATATAAEPHRPGGAFPQQPRSMHLVAQPSREGKGDTRSPSPDSLCVDAPSQGPPVAPHLDPNSLSKEDLNFEEKERDERENASSGGEEEEEKEDDEDGGGQAVPIPPSDRTSSGYGSPSIHGRPDDNKPIVSGSSRLQREVPERAPEGGEGSRGVQRQTSGVRDVDAIPLVCGFVSPESPGRQKENTAKPEEDPGQQSMFSMFINLDEIPSPDKAPQAPLDKGKPQPSGGMYMFIEADSAASPKAKRRARPELEQRPLRPLAKLEGHENKKGHRPLKGGGAPDRVAAKENGGPPQEIGCKRKEGPPNDVGSQIMELAADRSESPQNERASDSVGSKRKEETPYAVGSKKNERVSEDVGTIRKEEQLKDKGAPIEEGPKGPSTEIEARAEPCPEKGKKGFFVFIEAENLGVKGGGSPKPKRRPPPIQRKAPSAKPAPNVMSKSAPSDCLLFSKGDSKDDSSKSSSTKMTMMMTKSVIDREEFMAQPPTRRNVSLNDKINESSSKIPRPVSNFKEKLGLEACRKDPNKDHLPKDHSSGKKKKAELNGIRSLEGSLSEAATSLSVSFSEITNNSLPPDVEEASEFSDVSSLLSSIDRSNEPSDQEGKGSQNVLGDDLLKMLLQEINTDVTIQIGEKRIRAHKCILASRCVYFAAMLSGHWVESAGNVIKLQGFSAESIMVALKHIYSGGGTVPENVKVSELAALADMLALDGLKDVVALHLKANSCHYFHKPCPECITGVLEVLPIAGAFGLEELYHKSLRWVAKHFPLIVPTRNFANLPSELQDRCLKQMIDDMSVSTVVESVIGGERILSQLPVVRWTQPVFDLTAHLLEAATNFIAANLNGVLASDRFLALGREDGWSVENLEDTFKMACELVRPDQAVLSHIQLTKLIEAKQDQEINEFTDSYVSMLSTLLKQIEKFIIHNANRVAVCRKWPLLPPETQKRIKDAALVVVEFSKPLCPRPKFTSANKIRSRGSSIEPVQRMRTSSMSDHRLSRSVSTTAVPPKNGGSGSAKRLQSSGRCHTPPPSVLRASLQTPPPTRASTLRAQARQAAIQRSQSARTVAERPARGKPVFSDASAENDSSSNSGGVKSLGPFPRSRTSSQSSFNNTFSSASRSSTPGLSDRTKHRRNASGPQLMPKNKILPTVEDSFLRRHLVEPVPAGREGFLRAHNIDREPKQPPRSSSIGASPLHHLGSLRESLPRDQRKQVTPSRAKGRPNVKQRLPLRENSRIAVIAKQPAQMRETETSQVEVIGLGSRSNTFCKDDRPPAELING